MLKFLAVPSGPSLEELEKLPGYWRGRAQTRLQCAAVATGWQDQLRHLALAAEYERREQRARDAGV
jgi:hypothetical protein